MPMRVSGMYSGLDTESIIEELVKSKSAKVKTLNKEKTKLEWKQEAWSSLNTKVKSLFNGTLSNLRFSTSYKKKNTKVSSPNAVSVITGEKAMNGVQTLSINKLAKSGYMTGAKVKTADGSEADNNTLLKDLRFKTDASGEETSGLTPISGKGSFTVMVNGKSSTIEFDETTTMEGLVTKLKDAGIDANFDAHNQRMYIASAASGFDADFAITADNAAGFTALSALGINESLGTSTDTEVNANAKTLARYQELAAYADAINSAVRYKEVPIMEEYDTGNVDEDGNPIMDTRQKMIDSGEVDTDGNPIMVGATETVVDEEATMALIDVDSDLYKMIKAEMSGEDDEDYGAAVSKFLEKASFARDVLAAGSTYADKFSDDAVRIAGQDAEITLNGVTYKSGSNNVEVNGLTFTCLSVESNITITTQDDTDGIYDMIKSFVKEYDSIINELDKLYNADSARGFEPLSDEEKDEMSEEEIKKWESKIKDSLLRRDSSISTLSQAMKSIMAGGYEVNGKMMYLSDFGIETLDYFLSGKNEKNAYHIAGDPDDKDSSASADKLKSMIANDPDSVVSFFTQLSRTLYSKMNELSASSDYSSSGSFFDDKKYKSDLSDFESKISDAESRLADYEDKYYKKFSNMEVALSKLESSTSSITSLLGN